MTKSCYPQRLAETSIRLLQLLPKRDGDSLKGTLFEYRLRNTAKSSYPYEALSYVWGGDRKPQSISIGDLTLDITQNLYEALLYLRDDECSRLLWVDAVCINQEDDKEKEAQIPLMAEIYSKALRVVVWLGNAENESDRAVGALHFAGEMPARVSEIKPIKEKIRQLLERPWFRRIWVLQEIAAAQHIRFICGSTEIDGHAFCLGLDHLRTAFEDIEVQVTFLIRGAIFRSGYISRKQGRRTLDICSLGELLDMYQAYGATKPHDKIYALLGMCSDDLSAADLRPDYSLPWRVLMQRVIKFVLSDHASVETWGEKQMAVVKCKGCAIGKIHNVEFNNDSGGGQIVNALFTTSVGCRISGSADWILPTLANPIQKGDLICLLHGALRPTIVRFQEDHFIIVAIAPMPPRRIQRMDGDVGWSKYVQSVSFVRDLFLVWDWKTSSQNNNFQIEQNPGQYDTWMRTNHLQVHHTRTRLENDVDHAIRTWNVAQLLGDVESFVEAEDIKQKAANLFEEVVRKEHQHSPECQCNRVPLSWAAESGHDEAVRMLLAKDGVDPDLRDYSMRTPLLWAANNGHEAVVGLLLATGKVEVDLKNEFGRAPLSQAAENGHDAVVKLLLATGEVRVDAKDIFGWTALSWAARNGHEAVVKLLLATGEVEVGSKNGQGTTPLWWAMENGHNDVVKLLLAAGKAGPKKAPFSRAAGNGHGAMGKLLHPFHSK